MTADGQCRIDGDKLRRLREAAGLSADQLAAMVGCSPGSVPRWEAGATGKGRGPHPRYVLRLADALGVEPAELLDGDSEALLGRVEALRWSRRRTGARLERFATWGRPAEG